jgi:1-phosphofructokinase family hexose kinase
MVPGGKGLNVARAASSLGADVLAVGTLAGHAGRWLEEALKAEGVAAAFAWAEGETRSSLSVADRETGGLTEFYERGDDIGPDGWSRLEAVVRGAVVGASWMTMSGNLPLGAPDDGYARLIAIARDAGVRSALDARDAALAEGIAAKPDLVKVNAEEASALLGVAVTDVASARDAACEIAARLGEGGAAIVTLGADGAVVADPGGDVRHGQLYAQGSYPVGSGDAFLGALVHALDRGDTWSDATRLALGAATANAEIPGAGRLERSRAEDLARRADLRRHDGPDARGVRDGMTDLVVVTEADWPRLREIRLRALEDAPDAFGSTLERERAYDEDGWLRWIRGWNETTTNHVVVAAEAERWVGLAVGSHALEDPVAHVYAMWVEPAARGRGLGRELVEAVAAWALERGADELELGVTEGNDAAEALYRAAGFTDTGVVEPLRDGSALTLRVLRRSLAR